MSINPETLIVRREHLPERCEICHQSDQFDPVANRCSRCELVPLNPDQFGSESELNQQDFKKWAQGWVPIAISGFTGVFFNIGLAFFLILLVEGFGYRGDGTYIFILVGPVVTFISLFLAMWLGEQGAMKAQSKAKANNQLLTRAGSIRTIMNWTMLVNLGVWLLLLSTCAGIGLIGSLS